MTRRSRSERASQRRSLSAVAAPLLFLVVAMGPLAAAVRPASAAPQTSVTQLPIRVVLSAIRPIAPQPGNQLVVTGSLRNISDAPVTSIAYELKIGAVAIPNRGTFDTFAADPDGDLSGLNAATQVTYGNPATLQPGQSEPFRLVVPNVDTLNLGALWQVRELGVSVTGTGALGPQIVGQLRTFLPWAPRTTPGAGNPIGVAWLWPLIDRPHRAPNNTWYDDALAPQLAAPTVGSPGGRLGGLLAAGVAAQAQHPTKHHMEITSVPITWVIDPMLVSDAEAMTTPYKVAPIGGGTTTTGTGGAAATSWLATLRSAVTAPGASVLPLPYADPDVVAGVGAGFATAIGVATTTGRSLLTTALGVTNPLTMGWPSDGLANQRTVKALYASGDTTMVLSSDAVPVIDGPPPATPTAHTSISTNVDPDIDTLITDPGLSDDVTSGVTNPNGSEVALQRYLAETLMIQNELPNSSRDVVVAPARHWDPTPAYAKALLTDTGRVPWVKPVSLSTVDTSPTSTVARSQLVYPPSARHAELSSSYLNHLKSVGSQVTAYGAILPTGTPAVRAFTTAEQRALSTAWRTHGQIANAQLDALGAAVKRAMNQVHITSKRNSYVTLTSHSGKIPVTIANDTSSTIHVVVRLDANQRLSLSHHGEQPVEIAPGQQTNIDVRAVAKTSGVFPVQVQLLTPTGTPYGGKIPLFVRSTVYGTITLAITGGAVAVLLVAVAIRLTRRALAARRSPPTTPAAA